MRSSASHPVGPHGRLSQRAVNRATITGGERVRHNLHSSLYAVSFRASSAMSASTLTNHVFLGLPTGILHSTLISIFSPSLPTFSSLGQKSTNVGNFKIELGARYVSRTVHLSLKTKILSISFSKLWYNSLLWNRGVRNINFVEIGTKVRSVKNTQN